MVLSKSKSSPSHATSSSTRDGPSLAERVRLHMSHGDALHAKCGDDAGARACWEAVLSGVLGKTRSSFSRLSWSTLHTSGKFYHRDKSEAQAPSRIYRANFEHARAQSSFFRHKLVSA